MPTLDWHVDTAGEVTLVQVCVQSEVRAPVRIESCIDGPLWPPRERGVPAAGWADDAYAGVVEPDTPLVVGFATPADVPDPPVRLGEPPAEEPSDTTTPAALLRDLGRAGPPRGAIPRYGERTRDPSRADGSDRDPRRSHGLGTGGESRASSAAADEPRGRQSTSENRVGTLARDSSDSTPTGSVVGGPDFATWLSAVEDRVATAERLADVESVAQARAAVDDLGGLPAVRRLAARLSADRRALCRVTETEGALAERVQAVEVPVETLARVT